MAKGQHSEHRSWIVLSLLLLVFLVLFLRIVDLSVLRRDFLKHQGDLRALRIDSIPSPRARILDRSGVPMAISIPMESIWLDPRDWQGSDKDRKTLARLLGLSDKSLQKKLTGKRRFVFLKRHADPSVVKRVRQLQLSGINFKKEYRRFYPKGEAVAHLLGITNIDDQGQEGIELVYNQWLSGKPEKRLVEKDRLGRVIAIKKTLEMGKKGHDVTLSIDSQLQEIAYDSLLKGARRAGASSGSVVVLDPKTGEVLAMANIPSYNPNRSVKHLAYLRNQAITDVFEPGSTLKSISAAYLLQSGWRPNKTVSIGNGKWFYQGKWIKDVHAKKDRLTLAEVLQYSSNVGIAKMTVSYPANAFLDFLKSLGFGSPTFLGLPGEVGGSFESSIRDNTFGLATLSFGYGISVTNLQLAHAYAVLANSGLDVGVHILKATKPAKGEAKVAPEIANRVVAMLAKAVGRHGTGRRAQVQGLSVAGKTGTAHRAQKGQYSSDHYVASFVGMVPVKSPRWVISVVLNDPKRSMHFGGQSAAPIFADIVQQGWWLAAGD